ncbi:ubiquitin carboxyl-terminal hydrolase Usp2 isoform X2 [Wyeomyia smithii]|uniref:ubiquitin carboxyl-terminal hydrolase Usp2 isoform X2 n=1 Tax=Wyeomyia smithii TaxID=174621 RepID=UPI00246805FE|nr:ubiquitin carboxyl-terminal hydrolase Usp2 isoform X2 [Wyeomyia smithii]
MPVISAYSTSGSSYISPSYRYRSSFSDRKSYTTSSSTSSSSIYRRSSYRYDLPPTSSAYSSYRSDRTTDAELSASLSTLDTKDTAVESSTAPVTTATAATVNSRPSRYSTTYSYSSLSSAPGRDYSTRYSSRSSDTRFKDRDNNCLCTGGAGSSSNYISNLRSTALSGAELYQKYSVSTYKPSSLESRISARTTADSVHKSPTSIVNSTSLKAASPTAVDISKLRSGTASKSIHSTSPVGYRSRDYDSGLGSYRSGLGNSSSVSASVQKPSYNDRTNGDDSISGGSRKEGLCGLWNIGNTCFMNSVIQCLSHTRELTNFLRMQPTSERGTTKDHKILAEYTKLIKDMWNGINRSVNPSELKYAFSSKHRMYSGSAQQDAQEFLRFFIDSLHSALNVSIKREPISREIEDDDLNNRVKATMMWEWYSKVENSMIKDLFVGLLRSTLKCTVCNSASVTFDPFWDLSLPLPSTNSRCKLENCLDMFVKEEVMDGIDQPTCSKCKTRRKCTKSFTIERFPKYLVIHLKRFSETRWSKLTNVIEFPTGERELNLQPYASEDNTAPVYYSLYGISNHMGSTAGGHYVAVCKHPVSKEWHEFNDNFVSETSEGSLVTSSAYVLFYERA